MPSPWCFAKKKRRQKQCGALLTSIFVWSNKKKSARSVQHVRIWHYLFNPSKKNGSAWAANRDRANVEGTRRDPSSRLGWLFNCESRPMDGFDARQEQGRCSERRPGVAEFVQPWTLFNLASFLIFLIVGPTFLLFLISEILTIINKKFRENIVGFVIQLK